MSELKQKRKQLGLTQIQAANACGVSRRTFQTYEENENLNNTYFELYKKLEEMGILDGSNFVTNPRFIKHVCTKIISSKYPEIYCVYLFGSYSRGEATGKSNVELLVLSLLNDKKLKSLSDDLKEELHKTVSIITDKQLIDDKKTLLEVLTSGIRIYINPKAKKIL